MPTYQVPSSFKERLERTEVTEPRILGNFYNAVTDARLPLDLIRLEFEYRGKVIPYNRHQYEFLKEKQDVRRNGRGAKIYVTLDADIEFTA